MSKTLKKFLSCSLTIISLSLIFPQKIFADEIILPSFKNFLVGSDNCNKNLGWRQEVDESGNLTLHYYDSDNEKHIGLLNSDGKYYFFDLDGNLVYDFYSK